MKKSKIKILLSILLALISILSVKAQNDRDVVWVPGYGEDRSFWSEYAELFNLEREMTLDNVEFFDRDGIVPIANRVQTRINTTKENTIIVGHSLGGVVAAQTDFNEGGVRGIVTFGAPIGGARIANSVEDGKVDDEIKHAVHELTRGPSAQYFYLYDIVSVGNKIWNGKDLGNIIGDYIINLAGYNDFIADQTFQDLKFGSDFMTNEEYNLGTPKISVWGNENSPVHTRLASSFYSGGANDTELVDVVTQATNYYRAAEIGNIAAATSMLVGGIFTLNPSQIIMSGYTYYTASQWKRGKDYLIGSETSWKWLIGAYRYETATYQTYELIVCDARVDPIARNPDIVEDCTDRWEWITHSYTKLVKEPSDGFIDFSSQAGINTNSWYATRVEALGVNHMEMGTHPEVERILRNTWSGQYGFPSGPPNPFYVATRN